MLSPQFRRHIDRLKRGSARYRAYQSVAAPIIGLSIGIAVGILVLAGMH